MDKNKNKKRKLKHVINKNKNKKRKLNHTMDMNNNNKPKLLSEEVYVAGSGIV